MEIALEVVRRRLASLLAAGFALAAPAPIDAGPNIARFPADYKMSRAHRYAGLGADACYAELKRRRIGFTRVKKAPGVLAPIRLPAKIGGVLYRTDFPDAKRKSVPWEIFDCRLVLALSDFSKLLVAHDIDEVRMFSGYRPPSKRWPRGKIAKRHPGALAIDIRLFRKRSGETLVVTDDWTPRIGTDPCEPRSVLNGGPRKALELRALLCEAADARIFHSILTPNYDRAHFNHFHLEVAAGVRWFIVR